MTITTVPLPGSTLALGGGQSEGGGGSSDIPSFQESLRELILGDERYKNLRIEFKHPLFVGSSYFVSVVIALQPTESLVDFQKQVLSLVSEKLGLSISGTSFFFPHVSLYYGDGERKLAGDNKEGEGGPKIEGSREGEEERQLEGGRNGIAATITQEFGISSTENMENLILDGTRELLPWEIWVVKCEGPVEEWSVVEKIKFQE